MFSEFEYMLATLGSIFIGDTVGRKESEVIDNARQTLRSIEALIAEWDAGIEGAIAAGNGETSTIKATKACRDELVTLLGVWSSAT